MAWLLGILFHGLSESLFESTGETVFHSICVLYEILIMKKTLLILPLVSYLFILALKYLSDYITKDLA